MPNNNIPSLDLKNFLSKDPIKKDKFVHYNGKDYEKIDFVALKGHFLSTKNNKESNFQMKNFFDLTTNVK